MKAPTLLAVARHRGTEISNPFPSSGESTNFRFLSRRRLLRWQRDHAIEQPASRGRGRPPRAAAGRDRSGGGFPNAGYEPHPLCGDCPLTAPAKKSGQDIPKNHAKRNCPLSGIRSVSLSHDHAALALRQSPTAGTGLWLQPPTRIYSMSERVATSPRLH